MTEPGGSQLQMMLVQQAGPGALPLSILSPAEFLPFIRDVEQLAVSEKLAPVLVYWSRRSAAWLLPTGPRFKELMRDAFCVSIFSEDRQDTPDEWCFLIESRGLCLILYAQQALESPQGEKYQCSGSMNAQIVRQAFNRLLPAWQTIELGESNRLEDARINLGPCGSANHFVDNIRNLWPVVKSPIQQNLILKPQEVAQQPPIIVDHGKVNPIALEASAFPGGAVVAPPRPLPAQQPGNSPIAPQSPFAVPGAATGGDGGGGHDPIKAQQVRTQPLPKPSAFELPKPKQLKDQEYLNTAESEFETTGDLTDKLSAAIGPDGQPLPPRPSALRGLRQTLADENQAPQEDVIIPVPAQAIISDIIGQLRHSSDLTSILQYAIETLTQVVQAERGLIWQVVGDQLAVTNEFATSGHTCFVGNQLGSQESTAIVLEFLSRFPDESGAGVISIPDTSHDTNLHKMSPTLSSLIELGEVRGRLMVQLRSRGIFSGFLELQQCGGPREWSRHDAVILQSVAEMLSVVVQQSFDQSKIEMDAREMKLINEIASLFRDSRGQSTEESLVKSVMLVAEHMGFTHSQIYLYDAEENVLKAQIKGGGHSLVDMNNKDNPFVAVFESGRGKIVNAEFTRKGDKFFGHDMALVLPLISEGERLGVIGLWQRLPNKPQFRPQDRELGLTIAGHLSNVIRAEQAITMIRAEQARAALINKVSSEIRQSLKEVDQIMETLVECVHEYFGLSLCVVSLFDSQQQDFTKSKTAGLEPPPAKVIQTPDEIGEPKIEEEEPAAPNFGEQLLLTMLEDLKLEQRIFLSADQIREKLAGKTVEIPDDLKSATLFPLVHAGNFKAGLCLVSADRETPFPEKDMHMVTDLADRVAVVVSHAELFAQVERQAVTDPMTGLFNRRYFTEQLTKEIDRYQRFGHPFSYIIVDLDYLKKINDSLGHHFGDAAIKHIANVMKRSVRDVDTVGRFGGEEFVVLLPETAHENARMVANRICAAIRAKPVEGIGVITASLGLATFPQDAQDKDKLQELADQALYLAKHRGRNQVCSVIEDLIPSQVAPLEEAAAPVAVPAGAEAAAAAAANAAAPKSASGVETAGTVDLALANEKGILGLITQIVKSIDEKDAYGNERSPRAYSYANSIAQALRLSKEHAELVSLSAAFSNIGKLSMPEELLRKNGPLSEEELVQIRKAPSLGAKFLEPAKMLYKLSSVIEALHEHWDGSGYPKGLKNEEIPLESRIIALVDSYVAMTSDRPYRKSLSKQEAIKQIQDDAGKKFDPRLVRFLLTVLQKEG